MDERVEGDLTNKVGYAKPPKHTRFTKGRSGNPKGRPTGSKNLATMMIEELTQPVAIVENGKRTKIPKIRAAFRQALNRAMVGDFKALQQIVNMLRSHDALKRVATTKPITNHPKDYASFLSFSTGFSRASISVAPQLRSGSRWRGPRMPMSEATRRIFTIGCVI